MGCRRYHSTARRCLRRRSGGRSVMWSHLSGVRRGTGCGSGGFATMAIYLRLGRSARFVAQAAVGVASVIEVMSVNASRHRAWCVVVVGCSGASGRVEEHFEGCCPRAEVVAQGRSGRSVKFGGREEGASGHMQRPFVGEILRGIVPPRITGVDPASSTAAFRGPASSRQSKRCDDGKGRGERPETRCPGEEGRDLGIIWCG